MPKMLDPVSAPLVRQMFELYSGGGYSIRSLRHEMERRGLRNIRGGPVSKRGIEGILSNPFYVGSILVRTTGETFPGVHEPLISASLFQSVQDRKSGKCSKKATRHNHLFAGLFRCAFCALAMIPERQKGHVYYRCQTPGCPTKCVREESIDDLIRQQLLAAKLTESQYARVRDALSEWFAADRDDSQISSLQLQLDQASARGRRLTDLLIDGTISREEYLARNAELAIERIRHTERQAQLRQRAVRPTDLQRFLELIANVELHYASADRAIKRQIVELVTSNRYVRGKNPDLEPQSWLMAPKFLVAALCGAPQRPTSRTGREMPNMHVEILVEAWRSEEASKLRFLLYPNTYDSNGFLLPAKRERDGKGQFLSLPAPANDLGDKPLLDLTG